MSKKQRIPKEKVQANCDFCGSISSQPRTGLLSPAEAHTLPLEFQREKYQLHSCTDCGLVFLKDRPHPNDLPVFYGEDYVCYEDFQQRGAVIRTLVNLSVRQKVKVLRSVVPQNNPTFLDYGCGTGTWLKMLQPHLPQWKLIGTDFVEEPLQQVRNLGIETHCCDEDNIRNHVAPGSIGGIHLIHVIEHLQSPKKALQAFYDLLSPGGVVIGQTPNIRSLGCRFWGDYWTQWHSPRHLVLFSDETLRRHAESVGFRVKEIKNSISGATQWAHSFLHWWATQRHRPHQMTRESLYPLFLLASIPITVIESLISKTCHMDFILEKPR